jgi:uncharacterized damage-inducible protein DinB
MDIVDQYRVVPVAGCGPEIGASLWTLEEARRRTLAYVENIGQEALDYDPPGQRHGVATLLYHIAVFEVDWVYNDILGGGYDMERRIPKCPPEVAQHLPYPLLTEEMDYTPVSEESLDIHLARLAYIREAVLEILTAMSLKEFRTLRPTEDAPVTPEWVVEHLAQHEAEHRGQIWEARVSAEKSLGQHNSPE